MKTWTKSYFLIAISLLAFACSSNDDPAPTPTPTKSSAKLITSFKITTPAATGTITEADKKIAITVPNGTVVTALVPEIVISEKASVTPNTGVAQNFTEPVTYTVTAEDGTTQAYVITVTVSAEVSFTLSAAPYTELEQDGAILIQGTNFGTVEQSKLVLTNVTTGATTTLQAASVVDSKAIIAKIPADQVLGSYKVRVYKALESKEMTETFTVVKHGPEIDGIDVTTVVRGANLVITGKYFQTTGNVVTLTLDSKKVICSIVSESATSIEVQVPDDTDAGDYTLSIKSNNKEVFYNDTKITVEVPDTTPIITNVDRGSYQIGETITITGENLKKVGVATNINFVSFPGGTTLVRSAVASDDGTTVTYKIPAGFTTGNYTILIEVDGEYSEEYNQIIQIKP